MNYKYKFSIIIPIYNAKEYVEKTIRSVINQTIGFKKNIQLILINDGSTDESEDICLKYKRKYPENIVYYKKENEGVSKARNYGSNIFKENMLIFLIVMTYGIKQHFQKLIRC